MDREKKCRDTMEQYKLKESGLAEAFPEFEAVKDKLIYGEIWENDGLDMRLRFLVSIAALLTVEGADLGSMLISALQNGVEAEALGEVFHQAAPYIGFAKAEKGLAVFKDVCRVQEIPLPLKNQAGVNEDNRLGEGIAVQKSIFGETIDRMRANAPEGQKAMQDYLSAFCFGDTYTRGVLDLKTRELLTFVCICSLGGCESQMRAHAGGNLAVGNSREMLVEAVYCCLPYVGFPRSLNALAAINDIIQ